MTVTIGEMKQAGWATEQTLSDMKDLIQTGVQLDKRKDKKDQVGLLSKLFGKNSEDQKKQTEKSQNLFRKAFSGANNVMIRAVKGVIVGGSSLETIFKQMAQAGVDFLGAIPLLGPLLVGLLGIVGKLTQVVRMSVDQYLKLFDTGVVLNGNFIDLLHISAAAGISIMDMTEALSTHSETIVRLSTETNKGAFAFTELSRSMRDTMEDLNFLGLNISDLNEYFLEYLDIQRLTGTITNLNRDRTTAAFTEYMLQLGKLSTVTGIQRKELQNQINEAARDESFQSIMATFPKEVRDVMLANLKTVVPLGAAAVDAFKDEIVFRAQGITSTAAIQFLPELSRVIHQMVEMGHRAEQMDPSKILAAAKRSGIEFTKTYGEMNAILQRAGDDTMKDAGIAAVISRDIDLERQEADRRLNKAIEKFYTKWGPLQDEFRSQWYESAAIILEAFDKSGVFDTFFGMITTIQKSLIGFMKNDWNPFIEGTLKPGLKAFGKFINEMLVDFNKWIADFNLMGGTVGEKIAIKFEEMLDWLFLRIEYYISRLVNNITPGGWLGTSAASPEEYEKEKAADAAAEEARLKRAGGFISTFSDPFSPAVDEWLSKHGFAKGGIARVPSVFGEAGPEVAIPLPDGSRIPVAEVKRPAEEMKTFEDIRSLLEQIKERVEFQATETQTQTTTLKQIERSAGQDKSRIF